MGVVGWLAQSLLMQSPLGAFVRVIGGFLKKLFGLLNVQGWIGLALSIFLAVHWLSAAGESRHWKKQSDQFEQLYNGEKAAFDKTVADYRAAAAKAKADDAANKVRVEGEQTAINQERGSSYETRIADARARAERLRPATASTDSGGGRSPPVPGVPAAASGSVEASSQDGLPPGDALIATEQAIQLDELIKWIRQQHAVDPNAEKN